MATTEINQVVRKLKKWMLLASSLAWIASLVVYFILENTYVTYSRVPNPASGRVIPYVAKGVRVYITDRENDLAHWTIWILVGSGVLLLISLVLNRYWLPKSMR